MKPKYLGHILYNQQFLSKICSKITSTSSKSYKIWSIIPCKFKHGAILEGKDTPSSTRFVGFVGTAFYVWVNSSNSCDRLSQMEEQNYQIEIKKSIFFANSSPETIVHLVQKALHRSPEFCGNPLKLDLSD